MKHKYAQIKAAHTEAKEGARTHSRRARSGDDEVESIPARKSRCDSEAEEKKS